MTKLPKGQRFVNTAPDNFTITKAEFMYTFIARFPKYWILHNQTVVRNFPYFNELFYVMIKFNLSYSIANNVFDCIMNGIEKQFNVSCDQSDKTTAIELFGPMFKNAFSLKNNPADCEYSSDLIN